MLFNFPHTNTKIVIKGPADFVNKVSADLFTILGWPSGPSFFLEIISTRWHLTIIPRLPGSPFNECRGDANGLNVLALGVATGNNLTKTGALNFAFNPAHSQWPREVLLKHVATQLVHGMPLATYDSVENAKKYRSRPIFRSLNDEITFHREQLETLMRNADSWNAAPPNYEKDLQRIMRSMLPPGTGCNCVIWYDPENIHLCKNSSSETRLPVLGLAHEMVHAWRYMTGRALYIKTPYDIEEVITTGLVPYQYEPYSENLFRTQCQALYAPPTELRLKY
jgi:hypothetical protein